MAHLPYTLVLEPTDDLGYWGYFSPDLPGFTGAGTSLSDCIESALASMEEFVEFLQEVGEPVPPANPNACIRLYDAMRDDPDELDPGSWEVSSMSGEFLAIETTSTAELMCGRSNEHADTVQPLAA